MPVSTPFHVRLGILVGLAVVGGVAVPVASAQPPSPARPPAASHAAETVAPSRAAGGGLPQIQLLGTPQIRQELNMTPQQEQKLQQLQQSYQQEQQRLMRELQGLSPEQQRQKYAQLQQQAAQRFEQLAPQIEQLLTAEQRSQLEKIYFQITAYAALADPQTAEQLNLSREQQQKIQQLYQQVQDQLWKLQQQAAKQIVGVLTPQQQGQLKEQLQSLQAAGSAAPQGQPAPSKGSGKP